MHRHLRQDASLPASPPSSAPRLLLPPRVHVASEGADSHPAAAALRGKPPEDDPISKTACGETSPRATMRAISPENIRFKCHPSLRRQSAALCALLLLWVAT